jgi:acetyltransferase-like isoleucine patch superfamily enzyme
MNFRRASRILFILFRYDLPLWLAGLTTNWWPDNRLTVVLRGLLFRPFISKCGKNLALAKNVHLKSTDRLSLGDNVYIATGVWLNAMGGMTIEDGVVLGPYVVISTGIHQYRKGSVRFGGTIMSPVTIGRDSWLAAHVVVKAGVKIGAGTLVTANAVVTKDLEEHVVAGGVPARIIKEREDTSLEVRHSRF